MRQFTSPVMRGIAAQLCLALSLATAALAASDEAALDRANQALTDALLVPLHVELDAAATSMREATAAYCAGTTSDPAALDAGFDRLMTAWQRVQPLALGPVMEGKGPARFQFWPDKRGTGARQLRQALAGKDPELLGPERFAGRSVALTDLQALEAVVYDEAKPTPGSFRCGLAERIATHQADLAHDLLNAWTKEPGGFAQTLRTAGAGNDVYYDASEATRQLFAAMLGAIDTAIAVKLDGPMGKSLREAAPKAAESWRSGHSLANIAANIETARDLFVTPGGFHDLLANVGSGALADGLSGALNEAVALSGAVSEPLVRAVADPDARAKIETLLAKLKTLRLLIGTTVSRELGLSSGFNASDGD